MASDASPRAARRSPGLLLPVLLILLGALITLYPVGATFYNTYHQTLAAQRYGQAVTQAPPAQRHDELERARAYNAALPATALQDPWTRDGAGAGGPDYAAQLASHDAMARLRVPAIGVDLPVHHGTDEASMSRGAGHLAGTSLPVGGPGTHSVLTTHSGLANAKLFDRLPELKVGEMIFIDVDGETLAYVVRSTEVVLPSELDSLRREPGRDLLTLFTCTPRAVNTHRLLVHAERVDYTPPAATTRPALLSMDWSIQRWMWPRLLGAALALVVLCVLVARELRRRSRRTPRLATLSGERS